MTEARHVDATRGDVGGHEDAGRAGLERGERLRALGLAPVAVDALGAHAATAEALGDAVGAVLGACEHQRVADTRLAQQLDEQRQLQLGRHRISRVRDADGRGRRALDVDRSGVAQQLARQRGDRRRQRRREEHRLAARRQHLHDAADVGEESHVEHPVGLVEHEDLQTVQPRIGPLQVIEEPARRGDEDVGAAAEGRLLGAHGDAAEHCRAGDAREARQGAPLLVDLGGELPRRRQHEGARDAGRSAQQALEDRQQECCGLAGTSRPAAAGGMASFWIGVGTVKSSAATARSSSG